MTADYAKAIKEAMHRAQEQIGHVNLLITGKTGVGKSTLVNAIFGEDLAITGQGRPVTTETREYSKKGYPLSLFDSRGLEIVAYKEILAHLEGFIRGRSLDKDPKQHIHVAWLCIDEGSRRIEDAERRLVEMLSSCGVPVIGVVTKAQADQGFRQNMVDELPDLKNVCRVRAIAASLDEGAMLPAIGLEDLVRLTIEVVPEAHRIAFAAAQKVSAAEKRAAARKIVLAAAASAGAVGGTPIPFSDAILISPIQLGMLAAITRVYELRMSDAPLKMMVSGVLTAGGGVLVGRTIVTGLLKLIPGANIAGSIISAATAAALTTGAGEAYSATLHHLFEKNALSNISEAAILDAFNAKLRAGRPVI